MKAGISWVPDDLGAYGNLMARTDAIDVGPGDGVATGAGTVGA